MDPKTVFLVVDDFDPMRKVTVNQLRSLGASQVLTAANGLEALRVMRSQAVDVVLSDWNMPVMSGIDLFRAIRSDATLALTPFVMITAEAERRQIEEAIAAGVTELIIKPYSPSRLSNQIQRVLSPAHKHRLQALAAEKALALGRPAGAAVVETQPALGPELGQQRLNQPQLLIVDDAPDNLMLLSQLFRDSYKVRLAQSGAKALALCQGDSPPDLVLLDVMMPGMDGFEVLSRLREHPTSENIPVIFVTAKNQEADRLQGLKLGAVDYVTKPIDPPTLMLRVANFMRFINMRRQLRASFDDMLELAKLREQVEHMARHDVKAPVAAALGLVEGVLNEGCEHGDDLRLAMQALQGALDTINLSADLLKIESGNYQLVPQAFDVLALLQEVVATHRPLWQSKQLSHRIQRADGGGELGAVVTADNALCRLVLQNLLKNAWEASPPGAEIRVDSAVTGSQLSLRLRNHGSVPDAIRGRFFNKFVTAGKPGGTGLGTYSARLLSQVQGGDLLLECDDDQHCTTLVLSLPREAEAEGRGRKGGRAIISRLGGHQTSQANRKASFSGVVPPVADQT